MRSTMRTTLGCVSLIMAVSGVMHCGNAPPQAEPAVTQSKATLLADDRSIGAQVVQQDGSWVVKGVVPGSPAEAAGLQAEDVLMSVGDFALTDLSEQTYANLKTALKAGDVQIQVQRQGATAALSATAGKSAEVLPALFGNGEANSAYYCYWDCLGPWCYSAAPYAYWCGTCFACISM